ncbi:MAG: hypothetical protein GKR89_01910 [Candidatus Latescibacteria bacterium]|nr:hypothetical protein [Candidatus Latescibacterota bacterium]
MRAFDHIGIVTDQPQDGESWVPASQVWVTNPRTHPQRIEYVRFKEPPQTDPGDVGQWKLAHLPHVAYRVDDLEAAIEDEEVVYGPFEPGDFARAVFVHKDGAIVEYIEYRRLDTWFGQATPWCPAGP